MNIFRNYCLHGVLLREASCIGDSGRAKHDVGKQLDNVAATKLTYLS